LLFTKKSNTVDVDEGDKLLTKLSFFLLYYPFKCLLVHVFFSLSILINPCSPSCNQVNSDVVFAQQNFWILR